MLILTKPEILVCHVTYLQVLGIRAWTFWGDDILPATDLKILSDATKFPGFGGGFFFFFSGKNKRTIWCYYHSTLFACQQHTGLSTPAYLGTVLLNVLTNIIIVNIFNYLTFIEHQPCAKHSSKHIIRHGWCLKGLPFKIRQV